MSDFLVTTPVKGALCPRCHAVILTGLAEGLHTRVDLTPLNRAGEIHALLAGRWTYTLTRSGLVHRDATRIAGTALHGPTLPAHHCGQPTTPEHLATGSAPATTLTNPDQPPY